MVPDHRRSGSGSASQGQEKLMCFESYTCRVLWASGGPEGSPRGFRGSRRAQGGPDDVSGAEGGPQVPPSPAAPRCSRKGREDCHRAFVLTSTPEAASPLSRSHDSLGPPGPPGPPPTEAAGPFEATETLAADGDYTEDFEMPRASSRQQATVAVHSAAMHGGGAPVGFPKYGGGREGGPRGTPKEYEDEELPQHLSRVRQMQQTLDQMIQRLKEREARVPVDVRTPEAGSGSIAEDLPGAPPTEPQGAAAGAALEAPLGSPRVFQLGGTFGSPAGGAQVFQLGAPMGAPIWAPFGAPFGALQGAPTLFPQQMGVPQGVPQGAPLLWCYNNNNPTVFPFQQHAGGVYLPWHCLPSVSQQQQQTLQPGLATKAAAPAAPAGAATAGTGPQVRGAPTADAAAVDPSGPPVFTLGALNQGISRSPRVRSAPAPALFRGGRYVDGHPKGPPQNDRDRAPAPLRRGNREGIPSVGRIFSILSSLRCNKQQPRADPGAAARSAPRRPTAATPAAEGAPSYGWGPPLPPSPYATSGVPRGAREPPSRAAAREDPPGRPPPKSVPAKDCGSNSKQHLLLKELTQNIARAQETLQRYAAWPSRGRPMGATTDVLMGSPKVTYRIPLPFFVLLLVNLSPASAAAVAVFQQETPKQGPAPSAGHEPANTDLLGSEHEMEGLAGC